MRQLQGWATAAMAVLASGCWKTEFAELPADSVAFAPAGVEVPPGWVISSIDVPLLCPDGEFSRYYAVYPEGQLEPMPAAVVYTSGAFDYVYAADPQDPLGGAHYAEPARLSRDWSVTQVYTTLGMYPVTVAGESHEGTLIASLAASGVAVLLPANCWGDLWHNAQGSAENQFTEPNGDYFFRNGRLAAEWGYRFLVDPTFAGSQLVRLPMTVDATRVYAIGLGEGGRAVGELLSLDYDANGAPDYRPAAVMLDSMVEDLGPWYADTARYATIVSGLDRIFPLGEEQAQAGTLSTAPELPARLLYVFDPTEPGIPPGAHGRMLDRIAATGGVAWPFVAGRYPVTNAGDPAVANAAVA
ncbi:MAG: hypothetical protein H0V89_04720 [Deltaproteobacteria bacterium]|nr:hypothetical protein [Deltaproteobacteria bacterium]